MPCPAASLISLHSSASNAASHHSPFDADEEVFIYPAAPAKPRPSPSQLESLFAAASFGDLNLLKERFKNALESGVESFSLANGAMSRTGSTAFHAAASRGYIDIVVWRKSISC